MGALAQTQAQALSRLKAAAVQFHPKLGDLPTNLSKAEALTRDALGKGANLVVLLSSFLRG